ncbi:MAG: TAT-variant-translocated molybdopterin oxidoreductase [Chitinophagales bacterium]|nr:TAT-variant-translocated molybdopterin oxidoreductase [Bacteroidota bacterium]MCB9044365.1 TAT-variant-translocated molybdopterin oxidoreductase [Chitinophagales bacterium]
MKEKKYWKGLDELNQSPEFLESKKNEFAEELPVLEHLNGLVQDTKAPRRDFLKMLGFSLTAATVAASCEMPIRKAIPYVVKPEEINPGIANYYASTFVNGSDFCSVLVKSREGRPIKIEGNSSCQLTQGGTTARAQASVLDLYDMARLRNPKIKGKDANWEQVDKEIKTALSSTSGDIVLLTSAIVGPSSQKAIEQFKATYPQTKVVVYDAISNAALLDANAQTLGKRMAPYYHFDKADVVVGVGCDFLGTWLLPAAFAPAYAKKRKVNPENPQMSRHFQFESYMSITGAKADYRSSVKPSQEALVLVALYNELNGGGSVNGLSEHTKQTVKKAAVALKAAAGKSLVVCGLNDVNAQMLTNAINSSLGNYGNTIDTNRAIKLAQSDDKAMKQLVSDMNSGSVGTIIINDVNPAYNYAEADKFVAGLKKVKTTISFNDREDETAENISYLTPASHYLESWNDVEAVSGHYTFIQPLISPLFKTRQWEESLLNWAGNNTNYYDFVRNNWTGKANGDFELFWQKNIQEGVLHTAASEGVGAPSGIDASGAAQAIQSNAAKAQGIEVVLYETVGIGNGKYANNPFLQELPDPISRVTWENCAVVPLKTAETLGLKEAGSENKNGNDVIKVSVNGKSIEVPITIQPGQTEGVISVAMGYGRTKPGNKKCTLGANVFPMVNNNGDYNQYAAANAQIEKVDSGYPLAQTQTHHTIDDEREIVNETSLHQYKKDHWSGNYNTQAKKTDPHYADHHYFSLYPDRSEVYANGHHWGMAVDMNACIGCGACVVACNIENNVPVVGKREVYRAHEMHWMRIDRYYSFDKTTDPYAEHPAVAFQPMMCQHCDNAPCENVCPVNATNHSSEGLNQMAYNRCIGTRYCANNCPFKVRRFNWFDFQGADSFYKGTILSNDENVIMDDLSRLVLNPDVTVRSRGVMEKCSFCVQNLQAAKLEAKKAGRPLKDGDAKTACQTSCPTQAIMFGDMNIKDSEIVKAWDNERAYTLLDHIEILSSVAYQTIIRNVDEVLNPDEKPHVPAHHEEANHQPANEHSNEHH